MRSLIQRSARRPFDQRKIRRLICSSQSPSRTYVLAMLQVHSLDSPNELLCRETSIHLPQEYANVPSNTSTRHPPQLLHNPFPRTPRSTQSHTSSNIPPSASHYSFNTSPATTTTKHHRLTVKLPRRRMLPPPPRHRHSDSMPAPIRPAVPPRRPLPTDSRSKRLPCSNGRRPVYAHDIVT